MIIPFGNRIGQDTDHITPKALKWILEKDPRIREYPKLKQAILDRIEYLRRNPLELRAILDYDPEPNPTLDNWLDRQLKAQKPAAKDPLIAARDQGLQALYGKIRQRQKEAGTAGHHAHRPR